MRSWLTSSIEHWWYPLRASSLVKILAFSAEMFATAWAGVADWYLSRLTNLLGWEGSTHILIFSVPFLGVTTMGAHHSVGSVTGVMIPWSYRRPNSALSLSRKAKETACCVLTLNGWASSISVMWNFSPSMVPICASNTVGNSCLMS